MALPNALVATATPTYYGWLAGWDTTTVADGSYSLQSVAYDAAGVAGSSAAVPITVDNRPPSTSVLSPQSGATITGSALLDAAASDGAGIAKVEFHLTGGSFDNTLIGTASPTYYGWLAAWDSTSVPDGSYTLTSVAYDLGGSSAQSAGTSITVGN